MARRKTGDKKATGREVDVPKVQADDHSIAFDQLHVGGNVGGDIRIGHTIGYTADQVSILLKQITTTLEPKKFDGRCPYKGLEVFEEEDAELFFGRERLVTELVGRVKESQTVFITGPSGSGKSSLVRAGLIHALRQGGIKSSDRWLYETMKPGREPIKDLALAFSRLKSPELEDYFLAHVGETDILNKCTESVLSGRKDQRFVLFVDQFEEVFTQINSEEERVAFINMLAHSGTLENGRVMVLFAMRSDFVSNCATYPALNELLSQEFRQIGAMQPEELVSAIALPAKHVGLPIEDELIARIINDMRGEPDALPLMQFALKDLFDAKQAEGGVIALTLKDYLQHGGIHKSLERHADATFAKLSESEKELTRSIFSGLIEIGRGTQDTKRTALFDELILANTKAEEVGTVVQKLADARLVITDEQAGKDTVTISHEKLIEAWPWLKKLVNENRDVIALQNEIASDAKEWEDHKRDTSYLYTGARLANAREQLEAKKLVLSGPAQSYIEAGVKAHIDELEAANQRAAQLRRRSVYLTVSLIAALIAVVVAVFFSIQSRQQVKVSRAGELAAQSIEMRENNFQISLLLGIEAFRLRDTVRSRGALLNATNANPQLLQFFTGHTGAVFSLAFSPDGKTFASGGGDNTIILWNVETRQPIGRPLIEHTDNVSSLTFSPDGKILVSGSDDNTIILWDVETRQPIGQPLTGHRSAIFSVAFSPDGQTLASSSGDNTIILWDVETHQSIGRPLTGHVNSIAFSPDGKVLASGGFDTIILWDIETHQPIGQPLIVHASAVLSPVFTIAFSSDSKTLASGGFGTIILWNIETRQPIGQPLIIHTDSVNSVAFSPDGQTLASGSDDNTIILWDVETRQSIGQPLTGHAESEWVNSVTFSPDGTTLASSSSDNTIILWDVESHQSIGQPLIGHTDNVNSVAFSPNGKTLASGSSDNTIILWDVESRQPIGQPIIGHSESVTGVAFSPNGKIFASGSVDDTIILWDVETRQPIDQPLIGHTDNVNSVAFSPDGNTLASNSSDNTIILWDVETRQPIDHPLIGHTNTGFLGSVAFSQDGKTLASDIGGNSIILWDVETRQLVGQPLLGTSSVFSVAFSPDGKTLASGNEDNTIILWDVSPEDWVKKSCQRVGRNFTRAEWQQYFPNEEYRKTCDQWPLEIEVVPTPNAIP